MSAGRRPLALLASLLIAGCAGSHPPLGTIQRIPGSTTREGHEIVPLDSSRVIHPVDGTNTSTGGTIRPLRDTGSTAAPTAGVIRPLDGHGAFPTHEVIPLDTNVVPLDSTRWVGTTLDGPITLEFLVGGILRYTTSNGTFSNGTWTQMGNTVQFEMNGHFADFSGRIRGARMSGGAHNRQDRAWDWEATRQ